MTPDGRLGLREKLGYASGDFASVLFFKTFSSFLMFFYTDIIGIEAAVIGTMLIVTRIFDAANDPLMGILCDRTKSPHGKFRPWLRWMILPYAISGILVFTVPDVAQAWQIVYIYITYTLAMVFYTMINIPYGALMGVMTPNSAERTILSSFRFYGAYGANFLVQGTILVLVVWLGGSADGQTATQAGYVWTMVLYALMAGGMFLFTFASTRERVQPPKEQKSDIGKDLAQLVRNKPWVAMIFIGVTTIIWIALRDASILYYFRYYVVGAVEETSEFVKLATTFNLVGTLATLAGVACTKLLTDVFGSKRSAYVWLTLLTAATACLYYFAGPGAVTYILVLQAITSFMMGPLMPLFWSMIADTADYSEWKCGRRFTGLVFSAGTFSQKAGWAIGPGIAGWLLGYYGFKANVAQSETTIEGLRLMMSFIPSAVAVVAAGLVFFYGITRKVEVEMEASLKARALES